MTVIHHSFFQPPIKTVGQPKITFPPCTVLSPIRAAGLPLNNTVVLPIAILSGGPTQTHMLPMVAAGRLPINTVGAPGETMGPPTCGTIPVVMGQICISVIREAGLPMLKLLCYFNSYFHCYVLVLHF